MLIMLYMRSVGRYWLKFSKWNIIPRLHHICGFELGVFIHFWVGADDALILSGYYAPSGGAAKGFAQGCSERGSCSFLRETADHRVHRCGGTIAHGDAHVLLPWAQP